MKDPRNSFPVAFPVRVKRDESVLNPAKPFGSESQVGTRRHRNH